jgi:hypothetical protein
LRLYEGYVLGERDRDSPFKKRNPENLRYLEIVGILNSRLLVTILGFQLKNLARIYIFSFCLMQLVVIWLNLVVCAHTTFLATVWIWHESVLGSRQRMTGGVLALRGGELT